MPATVIKTSTITLVANTPTPVPAAPIADRRSIIVTNNSTEHEVWYGDANVAVGEGTLLKPREKNALALSTGLFAFCTAAVELTINELA